MERRITDIDENGEIIGQKKIKFKIFDDEKGYLFWAKKYGVKQYSDIKLSEVVNDMQDYCRCHLLAEHIYKDTNTVCVRINSRSIRQADIDDICNIVKLSYRRTRDFLTRMIKVRVLAERSITSGDTTTISYVFNPLFFNSSKWISPDLYFTFKDALDSYLPYWVKQRYHEYGNIVGDK